MSKRYDGTISTKVTLVLIAMAILEILARQYRRKTDYEAGWDDASEFYSENPFYIHPQRKG